MKLITAQDMVAEPYYQWVIRQPKKLGDAGISLGRIENDIIQDYVGHVALTSKNPSVWTAIKVNLDGSEDNFPFDEAAEAQQCIIKHCLVNYPGAKIVPVPKVLNLSAGNLEKHPAEIKAKEKYKLPVTLTQELADNFYWIKYADALWFMEKSTYKVCGKITLHKNEGKTFYRADIEPYPTGASFSSICTSVSSAKDFIEKTVNSRLKELKKKGDLAYYWRTVTEDDYWEYCSVSDGAIIATISKEPSEISHPYKTFATGLNNAKFPTLEDAKKAIEFVLKDEEMLESKSTPPIQELTFLSPDEIQKANKFKELEGIFSKSDNWYKRGTKAFRDVCEI